MYINLYSPHIPTAYVDVDIICHIYSVIQEKSKKALASSDAPYAMAKTLPPHFGSFGKAPFVWPSQMAVIKADAYGHGQVAVSKALMKHGAQVFASGSVQEACDLRKALDGMLNKPLVIALIGLITSEDIFLCQQYGITPLIHNFEQLDMLASVQTDFPIVLKCNTGMGRLGFNVEELASVMERLLKLPKVLPILCMSHLHSADSEDGQTQVRTQGKKFAFMLEALRSIWPNMAASLANSAGTMLVDDITDCIGPHVCRPGVSLYGVNPLQGTSIQSFGDGLLPTMWVGAPIIARRTLSAGEGIGYGHVYVAEKDTPVGVISCGYADGFSRGLTGKAMVCVAGHRAPLVGRVAMQMVFANLSEVTEDAQALSKEAWVLAGPYATGVSVYELSAAWGTIPYEVLCLLGYNARKYVSFEKWRERQATAL